MGRAVWRWEPLQLDARRCEVMNGPWYIVLIWACLVGMGFTLGQLIITGLIGLISGRKA